MQRALSSVSFDAPAGDLAGGRQSINMRTTASVTTAEAFEALEIKPNVFVGDVAKVTLGPTSGETALRANARQAFGIGIIRQATSNTLGISSNVRAVVAQLNETLPEDVNIFVTSDDAIFISGSIAEVLKSLGLAISIVVAVILLFLRDIRATLIPALTLPVALVGTFAAIYIVGFSINILTLLALVLATGMVVDDAIVVLKNIVRQRAAGMGPRAAAVNGTAQVFFAVVTTTATLAAVFVPLSFLPGQVGGLFREFGFTLAMAVMLSSVVALSLCPVLASRLLTKPSKKNPRRPMIWLGGKLQRIYEITLRSTLTIPFVIVLASVLVMVTAILMATTIRQEPTPPEDRAVALPSVTAPQGVALEYTQTKMRQSEDLIVPLQDAGEVTNIFSISGFGADNRGFMVFTLAKWGDRIRS